MNLDGSGVEDVALGVRNTVGFDFDPKNGELWYTNNGRDWLSEDLPNDSLNHVTKKGHFGFPYHQGNFADPSSAGARTAGSSRSPRCSPRATPARWACASTPAGSFRRVPGRDLHRAPRPVEPHAEVRGRRGRRLARRQGRHREMEPFLTGLVENNEYLGRPVDVLVLKDGSLLVSDDPTAPSTASATPASDDAMARDASFAVVCADAIEAAEPAAQRLRERVFRLPFMPTASARRRWCPRSQGSRVSMRSRNCSLFRQGGARTRS